MYNYYGLVITANVYAAIICNNMLILMVDQLEQVFSYASGNLHLQNFKRNSELYTYPVS